MLPIILVNYNSSDETILCIKSILNSSNRDFVIIIVDNNSSNLEYKKLIEFNDNLPNLDKDKLVIIKSNVNNGFAYGNNLGISFCFRKLSDWDFIWILNNDTVIHEDSINQILEYSKTIDSKCGIWGHLLLYLDNPSIIQAAGGRYNKYLGKGYNINAHCPNLTQYAHPRKLDYIIGASMIVRKQFIEDVGMMNEEYFLFFEELDWIQRGKKKGWTIDYNPSINILHAHGGSTLRKDREISLFSTKCSFRSRVLFTKKFHIMFLPFVLATCTLSCLMRIIEGNVNVGIKLLKVSYKAVFSNSL